MMTFRDYVREAWQRALADQASGGDRGELQDIHELCRRGVWQNWSFLTQKRLLTELLWCVGSVRKDYAVRLKFWEAQFALFRKESGRDALNGFIPPSSRSTSFSFSYSASADG
jgi:hypothetical protein